MLGSVGVEPKGSFVVDGSVVVMVGGGKVVVVVGSSSPIILNTRTMGIMMTNRSTATIPIILGVITIGSFFGGSGVSSA